MTNGRSDAVMTPKQALHDKAQWQITSLSKWVTEAQLLKEKLQPLVDKAQPWIDSTLQANDATATA